MNASDDLEEFARWYVDAKHPLKIPFHDPIYVTDVSISLILYRAGPWQVELYLVKPNAKVPEHSHPTMDSIEYFWAGDFALDVGDEETVRTLQEALNAEAFTGGSALFGQWVRTNAETKHSGVSGPRGGAFLSMQKWLNGKPRSASRAWEGEPVGRCHSQDLQERLP